ncbi:MAG: HYR domain-containing protein [Lewinellaceae bacterium]|nr:HYR domain-containing protein [Saprospiraceae bacterium]MCB9337507.1 HYR domain-containing protein [Lewinellaceae bacterium]
MRKFEFTKQIRSYYSGTATSRYRSTAALGRAAAWMFLLLFTGFYSQSFAQCALVCNDNVNVSLPGPIDDCDLEILVPMVLEEPYTCPNQLTVTIMTLQGVPIPTSPTVNEYHIGQSFLFQVKENPTGNSCWGTMKVEDKLGPQMLNCNNLTLPCIIDYRPTTDGGDVPAPDIDDCSPMYNVAYTDIIDNGSCSTSYSGLVNRTWVATDNLGNTSTCTQTITLSRVSLATYTPQCPANVNLQCGNVLPNTTPAATGYPTIKINNIDYEVVPGANTFCELAASFTDETFTICGGGYKILRTWNIYDWCLPTTAGMNPFTCIQVIKVEDTVPPNIVCPAPIVQNASSGACKASLTLPAATVTDVCSNFTVKVLTPFGVVNGNGGQLANVPVGVHTITYSATDACGNLNSCTTTLTVKDNTPPVAVCDEHTTVSLTADGTAVVAATVFDDGSTDNCGVDHFEVRRMPSPCIPAGTPFDTHVTFDCCDVGDSLMVSLKVVDSGGNINSCMVNVYVQDKIDPTIVCPPNKTIECDEPVPPVSAPTFYDNCPGATWAVTETSSISACGVGSITRTFTVTDVGGRTATCTQILQVVNSVPFSITDIIWPLDYYTSDCGPALEPSDLPLGYDFPEISEGACDMIAVTHTDQLLPTNPPACFKILRKWIVIDWCRYNPNVQNSPGYFEHTQILKVQDNIAPVLTCPSDTTFLSLDPNCSYGIVTMPPIGVQDCSQNFVWTVTVDYGSNGSIDFVGNTPNLSGNYPFGKNLVKVKAEDMCGNSSTCSFNITVKDGKKPSPICVNGLAVELMPDPASGGGMIQLTPQMFNQGSFDNCTAPGDLQFSIAPSIFDCDDVGINVVLMYVTDEAGNQDYCETYVIIQDNMVVCPSPLVASVGGDIATASGQGVANVSVGVSGNGPLTAPVLTTQSGHFQFFDLTLGYDYTFAPTNNQNPMNGVTTFDLVLMTRHILGIQTLDSPYKIIAADVNKSGTVTTYDVVELRKLILQVIPTFPNNTSWRFVDKNHVFTNPQNPFQPPFNEFFNVNDLNGNLSDVDFVAVKIGDVNGSAVTNLSTDDTEDRNTTDDLTFAVDEQLVQAGETFRIPIKAMPGKNQDINLLGYQFALRFDPNAATLVDIEMGDLTNLTETNFGLTMLDEGIITTSWDNSKNTLHVDNTNLFTLVFRANTNTSVSDLLQLAESAMPAEAYELAAGGQLNLMGVNLQFNNPTAAPGEFELYQNNPNPFRDNTAIGFRLPEAGKATLKVYDLSGNVLTVVSRDFDKGYNEILLNKKDLGSSGVLFYELETPTHTATRRMVRL